MGFDYTVSDHYEEVLFDGSAGAVEKYGDIVLHRHKDQARGSYVPMQVDERAQPILEPQRCGEYELWDDMITDFDALVQKADDGRNLFLRADLSADPLRDIRISKGDENMAAIRVTLNQLGYIRSVHQKMFHEKFIQACLPIIYGDDWAMAAERVMAEFNLEKLSPEVLIQTPRRFGKTVSVAMYVIAVLLNVPGVRICIFSTGKRASSGLMREILDRLKHIEGGTDRIVKHNQEELFICAAGTARGKGQQSEEAKKQANEATTSRLFSFPAGTSSMHTHRHSRTHIHSLTCIRWKTTQVCRRSV